MSNIPDSKRVYRTLLTLYAKQEGLKITFIDSPKEIEKQKVE